MHYNNNYVKTFEAVVIWKRLYHIDVVACHSNLSTLAPLIVLSQLGCGPWSPRKIIKVRAGEKREE
jgi:hypothetical protein